MRVSSSVRIMSRQFWKRFSDGLQCSPHFVQYSCWKNINGGSV
jgi:hypothetical protein